MTSGGSCHNSDISTAAAARAAIQDFFGRKFPELASSPLYITGESYAGVYIPTLADEILRNAPEVTLKGVAAGDPCTDTPAQAQSMDMLWYAHKHGFVPDADYDLLANTCAYKAPKPFLARGKWAMGEGGKWAAAEPSAQGEALAGRSDECTLAERKFLLTTSKGISQGWDGAYINEQDIMADAAALDWTLPDTLNYYNAQYMNREDVKEVSPACSSCRPAKGFPSRWSDVAPHLFRRCTWRTHPWGHGRVPQPGGPTRRTGTHVTTRRTRTL